MKKKIKKRQLKQNILLEDSVITIHKSKGNGILRRQIWVDENDKVTKYSLAYINHMIHQGDNGRVLCYDNAHNHHHKHILGKVEPIKFENFEAIETSFLREFEVLHEKAKKKK